MGRRCLAIWNSSASKVSEATATRAALEQSLQCDVVEPSSREETLAILNRYLDDGLEKLVVAGGDGTINSVVNALATRERPPILGLLPLGTANDLCCSLGIPDDPLLALQLIEQGEPQGLDVIEVQSDAGSHYFANMATGGNSSRVTESLTDELKQRWGPLCYLRGAIGVLTDLDVFDTWIRFDDLTEQRMSIWNILVANARTCGGRVTVAPRASAHDGLFDVILVQDGGVADIAQLAAGLITGDYLEHEQIVFKQVRSMEIRSNPPMQFTIDGELMESIAHTFLIHPQKIPVIVDPQINQPSPLEAVMGPEVDD